MAQRYPEVEDDPMTSSAERDATTAAIGSGLVIDMDRNSVRAVLFDTVGGHGRFISSAVRQSTLHPPVSDAFVAAREAIRSIEADTGLTLIGSDGVECPRSEGRGVDYVTLTGNLAEPVRLLMLPTGTSDITAHVLSAARRTPSVVEVLDDSVRTDDGVLSGTLIEAEIRRFQPDAVVVLDGENTQSEWATAAGTLSGLCAEGVVDLIIIVARDQYQQQAAQTMGESADLRGIDPNEFDAADIAAAIEAELHGLAEAEFDVSSIVPSSRPVSYTNRIRAGDLVTTFLARRRDQHVTAVTVGDGVMIHAASPGANLTMNRLDIDARSQSTALLEVESRQISGWLPKPISEEELHHWILNRSIRPTSVSHSLRDRLIEWAVTTAAIRTAWTGMSGHRTHHHDVIIGGSALADWDSPALALLCLLNALQPTSETGVIEVFLDQDGLLHAAGAVGSVSPALAADAVERDLLLPLASVVVVSTDAQEGDLAVRGEITYGNGGSQPFSVPVGSVHCLPLDPDAGAVLKIECEDGASIGSSQPGSTVTLGEQVRLRGGIMGVVIDARGRLDLAAHDAQTQAARVSSWLSDLGEKELTR